ncbi:MAG: 50S ribosomal protein L22 [Patescibacteria group bacterium]|jgi:large subunit ribosomal protein L22
MDVTASIRNLRIAPKKVRLIADLVRGRKASVAVTELRFRAKRAAQPMRKLIESAVANAEHNFKLKGDDLVITRVIVDEAVKMKRFFPRAFGRATPIRKRGSNVTLTVSDSVKAAPVVAKKPHVASK